MEEKMPLQDVSRMIHYGTDRTVELPLDPVRIVATLTGPPPLEDVPVAVERALGTPLDYPPFGKAVVPGDRVAILLDRNLSAESDLVPALWRQLAQSDVSASDVQLIHPASLLPGKFSDPRTGLPEGVRDEVQWLRHDPTVDGSTGYLATSAAGERIYLSRDILDADFVVPVGRMTFHSVLGYRSATGLLYPGFSTTESFAKAHGEGHSELTPDDERPLQQLVDEISWLLGLQFVVQVVPSAIGDRPAAILGGTPDATFQAGRRLLDEHWKLELGSRVPLVIAAVPSGAGGSTWEDLGNALENARGIVERGGRIVLLSDFRGDLGAGMEIIRTADNPREALRPLRDMQPADFLAASQFARATDWADVYWLSRMPGEAVEELFCLPLDEVREVERLVRHVDEDCAILGGAQHAFAGVGRDDWD
jgi:nickel-dependent lactate racemase